MNTLFKNVCQKVLLISSVIFGLSGCSENPVVAGGVEAGNPRVVGVLLTTNALPAEGVTVQLIPSTFSAHSLSAQQQFASDMTDAQGRYSIQSNDTGMFTLQGVAATGGQRVIIQHISVKKGPTVTVSDDSLRKVGSMIVYIPDSLRRSGGAIAIEGTTYSAFFANDSTVVIDSLPAGTLPLIVLVNQSSNPLAPALLNIEIVADETTQVSIANYTTRTVQPGDNLQSVIYGLLPGDTLFLRGGVYQTTGINIGVSGNLSQPISIMATKGEIPILRNTGTSNNTINVVGARYLTIDGITIDSTQVDIDGIKFTESVVSHHVTIQHCILQAIKSSGINAQGGHYAIAILSNHIFELIGDAVTGIRVAPAATSSAPHDWTITNNWINNCGDSSSSAAYGISLNSRCYAMTVRDNIVYNAVTSGIIVYGLGDPNSSGALSSIIEGNAVWNASEGISAYSDVIVRNNMIFDCSNPVYSYSYQGATPRNVLIYNNTMYNGEAPYLRSWDSTNNCIFVNNAAYAMTGGFVLIGNGHIANNAGDISAAGFITGNAASDLSDPGDRDFYPKSGSVLINKALLSYSLYPDFNGRPRDAQPDIGAYEFTVDGNSGWKIKEGFKGR